MLTTAQIESFRKIIWNHYDSHRREMPWRINPSPYSVAVSEIMLQQTQVDRVRPKFAAFTRQFPSFESLAQAPLSSVLAAWSGLGYNRRAKYLWQLARLVTEEYGGYLPRTEAQLSALPGIGKNTAGAIMAYAFNQPAVFVETNIRTVYIHHFFPDSETVTDVQLREVVGYTMDRARPRDWYYALMDYGTWLKRHSGGRLQQSRHYRRQPALKGSLREMRGRIIRALTPGPADTKRLAALVEADDRYRPALEALQSEGLIEQGHGEKWCLTGGGDAR